MFVVVHLLYGARFVHNNSLSNKNDNNMFIHCKGMCLEEMCAQLLIFISFYGDKLFDVNSIKKNVRSLTFYDEKHLRILPICT